MLVPSSWTSSNAHSPNYKTLQLVKLFFQPVNDPVKNYLDFCLTTILIMLCLQLLNTHVVTVHLTPSKPNLTESITANWKWKTRSWLCSQLIITTKCLQVLCTTHILWPSSTTPRHQLKAHLWPPSTVNTPISVIRSRTILSRCIR